MNKSEAFTALGHILSGYYPSISIEITRECPLRCPGCYAYEPEHLGEVGPLRSLADYQGQALIDGVLDSYAAIARCTSPSSAANPWCAFESWTSCCHA